jgi:hypothetical protein
MVVCRALLCSCHAAMLPVPRGSLSVVLSIIELCQVLARCTCMSCCDGQADIQTLAADIGYQQAMAVAGTGATVGLSLAGVAYLL